MIDTDKQNPLRRRLKPAVLALLALLVTGFFARNLIFGTPVETYEAVRRDLVQTVVASGRVMTPQRVSVGAVITGRVVRIPVTEGQSVHRGQVLLELDDRDERASVAQSQASVAQAEAKIRQIEEVGLPTAEQNLAQAQSNLTQARQQYERTRTLQASGFLGKAQLDDSQRNLDVAESQVRAARLQVGTNSRTGSDYALAQTALKQARANLNVAQALLEQTVVRAPVDGILIGRGVEPGNVVQPGKELMALAPAGETQIVVQIDEKNLARLALGQKALASADAFSEQRFAAELVYINPGVDVLRGSVEVKLTVPNPPGYLRQDMTASVDIEIARRSQTVVIPTDVVHDATGANPSVLAVKEGRARRLPVKLGLRGDGRVEVLEGVAPGDALIPATNAAISSGQRVRAVNVAKNDGT